jgi:TonB family protein
VSPSRPALHEEIPDVPRRARQTIRGHVKVAVRVIVDKDGTVFAALADHPGPSRYFERLAIDAAKRWTFPSVDTPTQRIALVRFDFTRQGTTGHAVTLQ